METDEAAREDLADFRQALGGGHVAGVERVGIEHVAPGFRIASQGSYPRAA